MYGNMDAKGTKISWKRLYEHKQEGVCSDFAQMTENAIRLVAYDYTAQHEISWAANHEILLVGIKNSEGSYDYFDGNNGGFCPYSVVSKIIKNKNSVNYLAFDSWQVSEPKIYKVTKLEKEAFKWGKAKKSSDLEKMYMNRQFKRDLVRESQSLKTNSFYFTFLTFFTLVRQKKKLPR